MAETVPGGIYKDAQGEGFHNANGQPVKPAEARKLQGEAEDVQSEQPTPPAPVQPVLTQVPVARKSR